MFLAADGLDWLALGNVLDRSADLRRQLSGEGFLLFRRLLPVAVVQELRAAVIGVIGREGWLAAGSDPDERQAGSAIVREGDHRWWSAYKAVQSLESFHRLAHEPRLLAIIAALLDGPILVHPRKIARVTFPGSDYPTPPHQDFPLIQGTPDVLTVWVPLAGCGEEDGALRVLRQSAEQGLRARRSEHGVGGVGVRVLPEEAGRWVAPDYEMGDALVFHSLTVHWAPPNLGHRLRLSCDYRYQRLADPVTEASLRPHYSPKLGDWDALTEGWSTTRWVDPPAAPTIAEMSPPMDEMELGPVTAVRLASSS